MRYYMNVFESISSSFNHYYQVFTYAFEAILEEQLAELEILKEKINVLIPNELMKTCTRLIKELEKDKVTSKEMMNQCQNYYEVIQLPKINAYLQNAIAPKTIHTRFTKAIADQINCYALCSDLNATQI